MSAIAYTYKHDQTLATTGYFSCEPSGNLSLDDRLKLLQARPFDTFLHRHLLLLLREKSLSDLEELLEQAYASQSQTYHNQPLAALILECAHLFPKFAVLISSFPPNAAKILSLATPLIYLRQGLMGPMDDKWHSYWLKVLAGSIASHEDLPKDLPGHIEPYFTHDQLRSELQRMTTFQGLLPQLHTKALADHPLQEENQERLAASQLYRQASDVLLEAGILQGYEMRHEASLSPVGLLREFNIDLAVSDQPLDYTLKGVATAYGRGFSLMQARISCIMEIIERATVYVSVTSAANEKFVRDRKEPLKLYYGLPDELSQAGFEVLPLEQLPLEVQPLDLPINYVLAYDPLGAKVLVPAQAVFLFANLNEPDLMLSAGSTGLAAAQTLTEAKIHALCEIIERDAEATMPFNAKNCFRLKSRDPRMQGLLDDYANKSIYIQFQDLTWELGVPVYQSFVKTLDGKIVKACACNLSGIRACLSALTEIPWPYSITHDLGQHTALDGQDLPIRYLEDLPDFTLPSKEAELKLLEDLLLQCGYRPLYIDLTRKDFDIPVVRAIIPKMQLASEFDVFSNFDQRLVARAIDLCEN